MLEWLCGDVGSESGGVCAELTFLRELFSKLVSLVGVGRITSEVHHFVFEVDGAKIKFDLAMILVIWIFLVLFDDNLYSPGFDMVKILFVF